MVAHTPNPNYRAEAAIKLFELLELFDSILLDEYSPGYRQWTCLSSSSVCNGEGEHRVSCDFCGADIFQSFFECRQCVTKDSSEGGYAVCAGCYAEGRSCRCVTMEPMQLRPFEDLLEDRKKVLAVLVAVNKMKEKRDTPQPTLYAYCPY